MRILFVTAISQSSNNKNLNHYQHVYHLSRAADLVILGARGCAFAGARPDTPILQSRLPGKFGLVLLGLRLALTGRARDYDIVLTDPSLLSVMGWVFKHAGTRRWVVDVWDIPGRYAVSRSRLNDLRRPVARWLLRRLYRSADLFIVSILPDYELAAFGLPEHKLLQCRNAIWLGDTPASLPPEDPQPTILCMRSIHTAPMGLDTLAAAYLKVAARVPGTKLVVIGRIPAHVEAQIAGLRGREDVHHIEQLGHDALQQAIAKAAVCVIPFHDVDDLRQTYPVKVLEYMALGKPIVASGIEGMRRMIDDGETGLLYRPGDADDLAAKLMRVLGDGALRARLSERARHAVLQYDCRKKNAAIMDALERLT